MNPVFIYNANNAELIEAAQGCPLPKTLESIGKKPLALWIEDFRRPVSLFWVLSNRADVWLSRFHWQVFLGQLGHQALMKHVGNKQQAPGRHLLSLAKSYAAKQGNSIESVTNAIDDVETLRDELRQTILNGSAIDAMGAACSAARYIITGDPIHAAHVYEYVILAKSNSSGVINVKDIFNERYKVKLS